MSKHHDDDQQHIVFDGVDDPIVADPDSETRPALESTSTGRSRILGEQSDCTLDPSSNLGVEFPQGADRRRAQLDAKSAHTQPRSALT